MHDLNKNFVGNLNKNSESSFSKLKITLKIIDKNLIKNLPCILILNNRSNFG